MNKRKFTRKLSKVYIYLFLLYLFYSHLFKLCFTSEHQQLHTSSEIYIIIYSKSDRYSINSNYKSNLTIFMFRNDETAVNLLFFNLSDFLI